MFRNILKYKVGSCGLIVGKWMASKSQAPSGNLTELQFGLHCLLTCKFFDCSSLTSRTN